ncbi:MAG: gamma-glutamyl-gamma-aminobutyrate hydrolase family protein [Alphaproteobacteria bacterium]|nr:gamma-glutamyl-gamma-aminobutyrate hydrolase family protein [Alphaproteobacteria bacterium]
MKIIKLQFEPLSKIFYVLDSEVSACIYESETPQPILSEDSYERLGYPMPAVGAPVVGLLMGRNGDCYSVDWNLVSELARQRVNIRFITYHHCTLQMKDCNGLLLPGGSFESSELYYTDPHNDTEFVSIRQMAYILCIRCALFDDIPILGICAGAQMVAAELGLKLLRNFNSTETSIEHKTNKSKAHCVDIFSDTLLRRILGEDNMFYVNSRHSELLAPLKIQLELQAQKLKCDTRFVSLPLDYYAEAPDGTPEAWGSEARRILCIQWHPEDMAATGDERMRLLFRWLAEESALPRHQ